MSESQYVRRGIIVVPPGIDAPETRVDRHAGRALTAVCDDMRRIATRLEILQIARTKGSVTVLTPAAIGTSICGASNEQVLKQLARAALAQYPDWWGISLGAVRLHPPRALTPELITRRSLWLTSMDRDWPRRTSIGDALAPRDTPYIYQVLYDCPDDQVTLRLLDLGRSVRTQIAGPHTVVQTGAHPLDNLLPYHIDSTHLWERYYTDAEPRVLPPERREAGARCRAIARTLTNSEREFMAAMRGQAAPNIYGSCRVKSRIDAAEALPTVAALDPRDDGVADWRSTPMPRPSIHEHATLRPATGTDHETVIRLGADS